MALVAHARFLTSQWPRLQITLALPRIRPSAAGFEPAVDLSDDEYALAIAALRLSVPDAGIVLSTRELPGLRDRLVRAGVTHMSAEVSTEPGGYTTPGSAEEQFAIADHRSVREVRRALLRSGYECG